MSLLHAGSGVAHLVHGVALAGALGGVGQQSHAGVDAEDLSGVSGLDGALHNLILAGIDVDGAVAHGDALFTAGQDEAGAHGLDAGLALDQLQSGTNGVSSGVGGAAQQAVGLAHLHQHGAEVVGLAQSLGAVLSGHLALAQFHHLGDHLVKTGVVGGVDDLGTGDVKAALGGGFLHGLRVAQQNDLQHLAGQQAAGSGQDAGIGALGEHNGLGLSLELFLEILKNGHKQIPPHLLHRAQAPGATHLRLYYSTVFCHCKENEKFA